MRGNFTLSLPTKLYFGPDSLDNLEGELLKYGKNVLFIYGGGSIKKNGIFDSVMDILTKAGKNVVFDGGVMSNPTRDKMEEGIKIARENNIDFILAVGGGSVVDYAKAVSASVYCIEDPYTKYYIKMEEPECKIVPVGVVLTMAGTGSEMNGGAVITDTKTHLKIGHVFKEEVYPRFAILNPNYTLSVPKYQVMAGIYDIFNHICEQYFSGDDEPTSDYIAEGLMREIINDSLIVSEDLQNYDARSNIMWTATWALNTLISKGKSEDWMVHMIGQSIGGVTNATHGMTLSSVSIAYYNYIMPYAINKFARFARNVWNVSNEALTKEETAKEGLKRMEEWMRKIGLVMNISSLGVSEDMFDEIIDGTFILDGGYKKLTKEDIRNILKSSL